MTIRLTVRIQVEMRRRDLAESNEVAAHEMVSRLSRNETAHNQPVGVAYPSSVSVNAVDVGGQGVRRSTHVMGCSRTVLAVPGRG
jgi:hypothetical protein